MRGEPIASLTAWMREPPNRLRWRWSEDRGTATTEWRELSAIVQGVPTGATWEVHLSGELMARGHAGLERNYPVTAAREAAEWAMAALRHFPATAPPTCRCL